MIESANVERTTVLAMMLTLVLMAGCPGAVPDSKIVAPVEGSAPAAATDEEASETADSQPLFEPAAFVENRIFRRVCDGSAAVAISEDTLLVAYDEVNSLFAFSSSGGMPVARSTNLGTLLKLKAPDEMDLEAAVLVSDRIWWIGSHGLDGDGEDAPNRRVLFATNVPSKDLKNLEVLEGPFDLTEVLLASDEVAAVLNEEVRKRKPKEGGLSIEGLTVDQEGDLVLGFRSPLSSGDGMTGSAMIVRIARKKDSFEVRSVDQLDLKNRGVRDLNWTGEQFLVLAGKVASGGPFGLYAWDGQAAPRELKTNALEGLNAESLVQLNDEWLVLSDDGKVTREDEEAADGDRQCDKIRKKNSRGDKHPNVFFRARAFRP